MRLLVVEDSLVLRKMLKLALKDANLQQIKMTYDGFLAIKALKSDHYDLMIIDLEMPGLNGLETIKQVRTFNKNIYIVVYTGNSSTKQKEVALENGADEYLVKSPVGNDLNENINAIKNALIPIIQKSDLKHKAPPTQLLEKRSNKNVESNKNFIQWPIGPKFLLVASSTGGPEALKKFLPHIQLPKETIGLLVQHMPPNYTKRLADKLNSMCSFQVVEAGDNEMLIPGNFYIAPGGRHLEVIKKENKIYSVLNDGPEVNNVKPSANVLFKSIAHYFPGRSVAIVLTGMGDDGLAGILELKKSGTPVYIQDESTSVVWGMPGAIFKANLQDFIYPIDQMSFQLNKAFNKISGDMEKAS